METNQNNLSEQSKKSVDDAVEADENEFSILYDKRVNFFLVSDPQTIHKGWLKKDMVYFLLKRLGESSKYYKVPATKIQRLS